MVRAQNLLHKTAVQEARRAATGDIHEDVQQPRRRGAVDELTRAKNEQELQMFFFPPATAS